MLMPFGKYRGYDINDIPSKYLGWLLENVDLRNELQREVHSVLWMRERRPGIPSPEPAYPNKTFVRGIYRALAMKWHPDRGGSTEAMQAINEFYAKLMGASG